MCSGFAIPIAQQFGAKNFRRMREFITGSTYLAAIVAALLTTATALLTKPILHAMGTPAVIFDDAYIYLFVPATVSGSLFRSRNRETAIRSAGHFPGIKLGAGVDTNHYIRQLHTESKGKRWW
jgi:Na+-driven multidrug efflux pump